MEDSDSPFMRFILPKPCKNFLQPSKFGIVASQRNLLQLLAGCASQCYFLNFSLESNNSSVVQINALKEGYQGEQCARYLYFSFRTTCDSKAYLFALYLFPIYKQEKNHAYIFSKQYTLTHELKSLENIRSDQNYKQIFKLPIVRSGFQYTQLGEFCALQNRLTYFRQLFVFAITY